MKNRVLIINRQLNFPREEMAMQFKVKYKLMGSFMLLVIFTVVVGLFGSRGIGQINYQNQIIELANRCLVDAQDVQSASLRYIIYQDDSYMKIANEEAGNVLQEAKEAEDLMLSDDNKKHTQELIRAMNAYESLIQEYYDVQQEINAVGKKRSANAAEVLENVKSLIDYAQEILNRNNRSGMVPASQVDRLMNLQEIQNATGRFRINANKYQLAFTEEDRNLYLSEWNKEITNVKKFISISRREFSDPQMLAYLDNSLDSIGEYERLVQEFQQLKVKQNDIQTHQREESAIVMDSGRSVRDGVSKVIEKVTKEDNLLAVLLSIVAAVIGVVIALILTRSITSQLGGEPHEIMDITSRIARGDLDIDFPQRKLTGVYSSMRDMTAQLTTIVNDIISASDQVTRGSEEISSSAQEISSGTSEQASNMEEVSASIEQLNSNIQQNTENAQQSNVMAKKVSEDSQEGSQAVSDTVIAMKNIAEKISIIQDIARSTNMLALNAAIEAARAGEAGRGFAVVASEVRKLAESSGAAAKDITEITQNSVHRAVAAKEKIEQIVPSMMKTADLVEEITMASQEQNKGAEQINSAIVQLDTVVQQNASASEELASMSEELLSQASSMRETISYFKVRGSDSKNIKYLTAGPVSKQKSSDTEVINTIKEVPSHRAANAVNQSHDEDFEEF